MKATNPLVLTFALVCGANAPARTVEKEPVAIAEIGRAASWTLNGAAASFGPDLAVETTPIEHWLELEAAAMR